MKRGQVMGIQTIGFSSVKSPDSPAGITLLTFTVAGQLYGLPINHVIRIIEMVTITQLPGVPDFIQGVINLGGKVVPVIDLRRRFGLPPQAYGLYTPIILVDIDVGPGTLGLIVDTVEEVLDVSGNELEVTEAFVPPVLTNQMSIEAAHLAGVAKVNRQMILVLNVPVLLSPTDKVNLSEALVDRRSKLTNDPEPGDAG
jgi:purine-binding chemotaxis protein CheW